MFSAKMANVGIPFTIFLPNLVQVVLFPGGKLVPRSLFYCGVGSLYSAYGDCFYSSNLSIYSSGLFGVLCILQFLVLLW